MFWSSDCWRWSRRWWSNWRRLPRWVIVANTNRALQTTRHNTPLLYLHHFTMYLIICWYLLSFKWWPMPELDSLGWSAPTICINAVTCLWFEMKPPPTRSEWRLCRKGIYPGLIWWAVFSVRHFQICEETERDLVMEGGGEAGHQAPPHHLMDQVNLSCQYFNRCQI